MIKWKIGLVSMVLLISLSVKSQISDFYLFPNPFTERVEIKFTSQALWQSNYDLRVFDIVGRERIIKTGNTFYGENRFEVNTSGLENGLFIFILIHEGDSVVIKGIKNSLVNIGKLTINEIVKVFPNPVNRYLNLQSNQNTKMHIVKIYDLLGRLILVQEISGLSSYKIDLEMFKPATYLVEITGANGVVLKKEKFYKQ